MTDKLEKLFNDSTITNFNDFYNLVKENRLNFSRSEVKKFYDDQEVNQLFKQPYKKFIPIKCFTNRVGCLFIDLQDISKFFRQNAGHNHLFNCIDTYSRYSWSFPIKNKQATTTVKPMKIIVEEIKKQFPENIITVTADKGSEFMGAFKKFLDEENIKLILIDPDLESAKNNMSLVERFNRTMWAYIKKYCTMKKTLKFFDQIPNFIKNYNNRVHPAIKMKPIDVFLKGKKPFNFWVKYTPSLKIGDKVRTVEKITNFAKKSFYQKWSTQIYEIMEQIHNRFKLKNVKTGKIMKNLYLERELQKINYTESEENETDNNNEEEPENIEVESNDIVDLQKEIKKVTQQNTFVRRQRNENIGNVNKNTGQIELQLKRQEPVSKNKLRVRKTVKEPENHYQVEKIIDDAYDETNKKIYLVKWLNYPDSANTWEPFRNIKDTVQYSEYLKAKRRK